LKSLIITINNKFIFILLNNLIAKVFSNSTKSTEEDYKIRRILQGIPEGPKEIKKSQSFPFEANLDFLNGGKIGKF